MPRKRRTKMVKPSKASAPSGDESSNSNSEDRKKKLELYLKDFDMRVANCLLQADNECKAICAAINHACMMELFKLPKNVREMTRAEFMAKGGSVNNNMIHQVTEVVDSMTSSILPKSLATTASSAEHKTVSSSQEDSSASEISQGARKTTTKKKAGKGRKRTTTKSVLGTNQDVNTQESAGPPQTLRRSTRKTAKNTFVTPAAKTRKTKAMATGWDTPAITPKFDPRLPVTPSTCSMRQVKRGETIISLSGSPLALPSAKPDGSIITFGDGSALEIAGSSPNVDMSMNETTRQNILLLQNKLAKILKTCSKGQENSPPE